MRRFIQILNKNNRLKVPSFGLSAEYLYYCMFICKTHLLSEHRSRFFFFLPFLKKSKRKITHLIFLFQHLTLPNHKMSQHSPQNEQSRSKDTLAPLRNYIPPWYWYSLEITSSWDLKHMIGALGFYGYLRLQRLLSVK